jgi:D-galactarolactone isomerase
MSDMRLLPQASCDCHSHLYPPADVFPVRPGQHHEPNAGTADYLALCGSLGIDRHVLVQGKAYPDRQSLLHGIAELGPGRARGIVFFDETLTDDDLATLRAGGVCGFRFLFRAGEPFDMAAVRAGALAAAAMDGHVIVQAEGAELSAHYDALLALPCPVVVDHIGRLPRGADVEDHAVRALLGFLGSGGWVKLAAPYNVTGNGRSDFAPLSALVRALADTEPRRLVWGLNFPHPNLSPQDKPDERATLQSLLDLLDAAEVRQVFVENPGLLYKFE